MMAAFNARAETIETKSFYFDAERTRCLIPVSGYREGKTVRLTIRVIETSRAMKI